MMGTWRPLGTDFRGRPVSLAQAPANQDAVRQYEGVVRNEQNLATLIGPEKAAEAVRQAARSAGKQA